MTEQEDQGPRVSVPAGAKPGAVIQTRLKVSVGTGSALIGDSSEGCARGCMVRVRAETIFRF